MHGDQEPNVLLLLLLIVVEEGVANHCYRKACMYKGYCKKCILDFVIALWNNDKLRDKSVIPSSFVSHLESSQDQVKGWSRD